MTDKNILDETSGGLSAHANQLLESWGDVIADGKRGPSIESDYKKAVIAQMLENQADYNEQSASMLAEATPNNVTGGIAKWDPVLIDMVRRAAPSLISFDLAGVQPMTGPSGLAFAMRARYTNQTGTEALGLEEANTAFSGTGVHSNGLFADVKSGTVSGTAVTIADTTGLSVGMLVVGDGIPDGTTISAVTGGGITLSAAGTVAGAQNLAFAAGYGTGMDVATGEGDISPEMAFSIERIRVDADTRKLKARYSIELAQDLRAQHRLDADSEMINVLRNEMLAEQNREFLRRLYAQAKIGSAGNTTPGVYDLVADADGRWSGERFKGLFYQIEKEANRINLETRRGKGNRLVCSADVVSALSMGKLFTSNNIDFSGDSDWNGNLYVGNIGAMKVYIDPYAPSDFFWVGYKGTSPWDAGYFFCPYTPYMLLRGQDPVSLSPIIAFMTRAGFVANPLFNQGVRRNAYYRIAAVKGL